MTKDELVKKISEIGIIHKEKITLRSGAVSDYYCDIKKLYGYPDILNALAEEVGKILPAGATCIAVSGYGGLPLGAVVSSKFGKKFTAVRSSPKNHGKGGLIDGYVPTQGDTVVIIDDVITSGSSILETLKPLQDITKVDLAIAVVERGSPALPIPYSSIFKIEDLTKGLK